MARSTSRTTKRRRSTTVVITITIPPTGKHIAYDRVTKDFAMYLNGNLVGYAPTYLDAECKLNELVYEMLR